MIKMYIEIFHKNTFRKSYIILNITQIIVSDTRT